MKCDFSTLLNVVGNDMLTHWPAMKLLKLERQLQRQWQRQIQINGQWHRQIHSESSIRERSERLVTCKTFDQNDKETWPDKKRDRCKHKDNDKDKYI